MEEYNLRGESDHADANGASIGTLLVLTIEFEYLASLGPGLVSIEPSLIASYRRLT